MLTVIRGAGDIATGVALRLWRAGIRVVMTDLAEPSSIRRTVCFSEAVRLGETRVEDVTARAAGGPEEALALLETGRIPVLADPAGEAIPRLGPEAVVDAILAKRNLGTRITDAPAVVGVGPGFTAGVDCHAVVETQRGHRLGRVIWAGPAAPNSGIPGDVGGYTVERVLRAPCAGVFRTGREIGETVQAGDEIARVDGMPVCCAIGGILRGLLPDGFLVTEGFKCGDVDPRCDRANCYTASDKALAVGGGVLEAVLALTGVLGGPGAASRGTA